MKFCPKCKALAFDNALECAECGAALASASPTGSVRPSPSQASAPPVLPQSKSGPSATPHPLEAVSLQKTMEALESQRTAADRRNRFLAVALATSLALLLVVFVAWHRMAVGLYARLADIQVVQDPAAQGKVTITFDVVDPGRVRYARRCGRTVTEVLDRFAARGRQTYVWNWAFDPGQDIEVIVRHRSALWRRFDKATFPTTNRVDIVFLMDTTESMNELIEGLKLKCQDFANRLAKSGFRYRLGLIGFGDVNEGQALSTHELVEDVDVFKAQVQGIPRQKGGDLPESALDALEAALGLHFEKSVPVVFFLITDADYHEPTATKATATGIASKIRERGIPTYIFSKSILLGRYRPFLAAGGRFYPIEGAEFPSIVMDVARQIVAGSD